MTHVAYLLILQNVMVFLQIADSLSELEALMERMKRLQEDKEDEEASQEEMATRFEKEKKESLLVISGGIYAFPVPVCLCFVRTKHFKLQKVGCKVLFHFMCCIFKLIQGSIVLRTSVTFISSHQILHLVQEIDWDETQRLYHLLPTWKGRF